MLALADRVFALERGAVFHQVRRRRCSLTSNTARNIVAVMEATKRTLIAAAIAGLLALSAFRILPSPSA